MRAIRGVDDMIALLVEKLDKMGILDDTFIFFTSDHGYKLGQWRLGCSKEGGYSIGGSFQTEFMSQNLNHKTQ